MDSVAKERKIFSSALSVGLDETCTESLLCSLSIMIRHFRVLYPFSVGKGTYSIALFVVRVLSESITFVRRQSRATRRFRLV